MQIRLALLTVPVPIPQLVLHPLYPELFQAREPAGPALTHRQILLPDSVGPSRGPVHVLLPEVPVPAQMEPPLQALILPLPAYHRTDSPADRPDHPSHSNTQ